MGELFNILYAKGESSKTVPKVADFEIKVPSVVPKQCNTYDCGLWLTTWMTYHDNPFEYNVGELRSNLARMKLALRLVMGSHNHIKDHIMTKVYEHATIRRRAINLYLAGLETADDGMR
ncbi:hypothetical protein LINPERHAP1_LOCUS4886, partial [Linum perenne]